MYKAVRRHLQFPKMYSSAMCIASPMSSAKAGAMRAGEPGADDHADDDPVPREHLHHGLHLLPSRLWTDSTCPSAARGAGRECSVVVNY